MDGELHRFTGKPSDLETDLSYFNARYYDSTLGRFTGSDPAKDGLNWYQYCNSNPIRYCDPSGEIVHQPDSINTMSDEEFDRYYTGLMYMVSTNYTLSEMFTELMKARNSAGFFIHFYMKTTTADHSNIETDSHYNPDKNLIVWNTRMMLRNTATNEIMSSSQALAHEIGHAWQDLLRINGRTIGDLVSTWANRQKIYSSEYRKYIFRNIMEYMNIRMVDCVIGKRWGIPTRAENEYFSGKWEAIYW